MYRITSTINILFVKSLIYTCQLLKFNDSSAAECLAPTLSYVTEFEKEKIRFSIDNYY